jgi:hypothetical protein
MEFVSTNHIENRRLVDVAAGSVGLDVWERQHIHECQICQGVLLILVRPIIEETDSGSDSTKASAA